MDVIGPRWTWVGPIERDWTTLDVIGLGRTSLVFRFLLGFASCLYGEVSHSVHHVYVCSSDRHPLAVVTPHDILRLVADRLVEG